MESADHWDLNLIENKAISRVGLESVSDKLCRLRECMDWWPWVHTTVPAVMLQVLQGGSGVWCDEKQTHHQRDYSQVHESVLGGIT